MAKVLVTEQYLEDIADAIRTKLSVGTVYTPGQMAAAILSIVSGEGGVENIAYSNGTLSKTINGATSTVFTADSTPTSASTNPVTSGGVYTALSSANAQISNILGDMATVEASSTASKNYVIGEYLVLNGVFYKVTAPIAQGGTITPGTNCDATTAGAELASLNSNITNQIVYETYNFNGTKPSTSTVGGRYAYFDVTISKTGYIPISACFSSLTETTYTHYGYSLIDNNRVRIFLYSASTAESTYSGSIVIVYMKN